MLTAILFMFLVEPNGQIEVPKVLGIECNGQVADDEYEQAKTVEFKGVSVHLAHDGKSLFIAIETQKPGIASISLFGNGQITTLHASAALGTATHAFKDGTATLTKNFVWGCRESGDAAKSAQEHAAFWNQEGWVSNARSRPGPNAADREFKISIERWLKTPVHVFLGYDGLQFDELLAAIPETAAKDKALSRLVRGFAEPPIGCMPSKWPTLALKP